MKRRIRRQLEQRKRKIEKRLAPFIGGTAPRSPGQPELSQQRVHYEMAERTQAISCGGIGAIHQLVTTLGLAKHLDANMHVLKIHRPYHDSDHVLNVAYNLSGEVAAVDARRIHDRAQTFGARNFRVCARGQRAK